MPKALPRSFYNRSPVVVAQDLLNKVIVVDNAGGRIVETEAYEGETDPACHAYHRRTPRNEVMYGPAGHLYVYFSYGMHWCANVVTSPPEIANAVLIRAVVPVSGIEVIRDRRAGRRDGDLTNGPGKLCAALAITGDDNGADLLRGRVRIVDDGFPPPNAPTATSRIGITHGSELLWRFLA